jgi:zinc finger protein
MDKLENQPCPVCHKKSLTLSEEEMDIPYFGKTYLFSMTCTNCRYSKSDVEAEETKEPCRITFEVQKEEDMKVRVVKSSEASIKIPQLRMSMESGPASDGWISNIEGLITRFEKIIEDERDVAEEDDVKKTAKNLLKKIRKVKLGEIPVKIIIEDQTGNSAIISDRAVVEKMKAKTK